VVLLPHVDEIHGPIRTAEKLINAIAQPHAVGEHQLSITLSIGISLYPDNGKDMETVVRNADVAMYHAKRSGRNRYQVSTPNIRPADITRKSVEISLHDALDQNRFILHYQPTVNLATTTITGAEALIRLQRYDHELVYPSAFLKITEDCGLIMPLGRWVLREACRQAQAWLRAGLDVGKIAVNVSAVELYSKDFLAGVRGILNDTGLDPRYLELDLTESGFLQDTKITVTILNVLKGLGVRLAVDDFGVGHSSLSSLRQYPIDTLKIDKSFIHDIGEESSEAIIDAVIAMGSGLKHRVIAEGIETSQQLVFLKARRCTEGQGHLFSPAVNAEEFAEFLVRDRRSV
jgi:EAL domain-containing protein (putative c-di-GMP-specific phosphodiesterase class I)